MTESITRVTWLRKGTNKKSSKREEAYFQASSAVRFAKQLESDKSVSDIQLEINLGIKDIGY